MSSRCISKIQENGWWRQLNGFGSIRDSNSGPKLAPLIKNILSKGLRGNYNISDGQLQPTEFEIVNVIGNGVNTVGFWTEQNGILKDLSIIWPGKTTNVPYGSSGRSLRVGVPMNRGFSEIVTVEKDAEVLSKQLVSVLMFAIEYISFENVNYDDLVHQVFLQVFFPIKMSKLTN